MTERTTVRLPEELLSRAKRKAAREGRTLTALIEDGLRLVVADDRRSVTAERLMPRVSEATGGLTAGADLAAVQESDDVAYAKQLKRF